jgi:hypothetical protein
MPFCQRISYCLTVLSKKGNLPRLAVVYSAAKFCAAGCTCDDANIRRNRDIAFTSTTASQIFLVSTYAPVALYAEHLRVQNSLLNAILPRYSVPTPITGCVKDFHRLWDVRESDLYGDLNKGVAHTVASLRHGNAFPLVNQQILEIAGILDGGRIKSDFQDSAIMYRATVVNVSFLLPSNVADNKVDMKVLWIYRLVAASELALLISIASITAVFRLHTGTLLVSCQILNWIALYTIRIIAKPVFGKSSAMFLSSQRMVPGGATLDIHVIAANANADTINVLCGYSSQVHSITNIPVRTANFRTISWILKALIVSLTIQAAALVSLVGNNSNQGLALIIWISLHFLMHLPPLILTKAGLGSNVLDAQPGTVHNLSSMVFSGRKAALAFVAHLPVTRKADKWAWLDVFMPDNMRRRKWQKEIERGCSYLKVNPADDERLLNSINGESRLALVEIKKSLCSKKFHKILESYLQSVGGQLCSNSICPEYGHYDQNVCKSVTAEGTVVSEC